MQRSIERSLAKKRREDAHALLKSADAGRKQNRHLQSISHCLPAVCGNWGPRESHTLCAEDSEAFASGRRTLAPDFVCQWFRYSSPPSDPVEAALSAANFPHVGDTSASRTDWSRGEPAARAPHFNVVKKKVLTFFGAPD